MLITVAIGVGSFIMSFAALRDLAVRSGWPHHLAWVWPLIVDGAILMATMAVVALAPDGDQGRSRRFFRLVLAASASVSVGCNALHAVIPRATPITAWLAAAIAMVVGIRRYQNLPNSPTRPRHVFDMTLVPACGQAR